MHIALICRYLTAERGGHERYLKRLIRALIGRGRQVTAFSGAFDPDLVGAEGLECIEVPSVRFPQWLRYLSFNRNAERALKAHDASFDLVFSTEYVTFGDVYRAGAGIARAEIESCCGLWARLSPKNRVKMRLQANLMKSGPQRVIVNSESMRRQVLRYYDLPKSRIALVYNGIDTDRFSPQQREKHRVDMRRHLGLHQDDFVCLAVGSNWRRKGIDRALRLMRRVPAKRLKLLVVGTAQRRLRRPARVGGEERVIFRAPTSSIGGYYAAADLCIVASRYDPAPNVILESLACALPVAISAECGLTELIGEAGGGVVFDDAGELAGTVGHFMEIRDTERYRQMQRDAARIGQRFTMERHVDELMDVLESAQLFNDIKAADQG